MKLYELGHQYTEVLENIEVDEETGELLNTELLGEIEALFDDKAENIALYIKDLESFENQLKQEKDNLSDREKRARAKKEGLKKYLSTEMISIGKIRLETPKCAISFRKSESVEILDLDKIPNDLKEIKAELVPIKAEIKKAIKSGIVVAGAVLVEKDHIQIK